MSKATHGISNDDLDYEQLRPTWTAYAARMEEGDGEGSIVGASFIIAKSAPPTVIALLDALAAQQKVVEAGAVVIAAQQVHVKNVRSGSDSMIHDTAVKLAEAITPYNVAVKHLDALRVLQRWIWQPPDSTLGATAPTSPPGGPPMTPDQRERPIRTVADLALLLADLPSAMPVVIHAGWDWPIEDTDVELDSVVLFAGIKKPAEVLNTDALCDACKARITDD